MYNLFFNLSINFSKNFHTYLEIYYEAILNIIKHKINQSKEFKYDYTQIINNLIEKSFTIVDSKKNKKANSTGFLDYFIYRSYKQEEESTLEQYKNFVYNNMNMKVTNDSTEDYLIDVSKILELIKTQEEEFIFFVTLSASKILDYSHKSEFYYSLIFLNEILDPNLSKKEFLKIWQNLLNIFRSKLEFKHVFDKEENLFDLLFTNYFFSEIMKRFSDAIDMEDYLIVLENYSEIEDIEVLFYLMEMNNLLVQKFSNSGNKKIVDKIFDICIVLLSKILVDSVSTFGVGKIQSASKLLKNLLENYEINNISSNSVSSICKIISIDAKFVEESSIIYEIVEILLKKLVATLPKSEDDLWDFFMFILDLSFKSAVVESVETQKAYIELIIYYFDKVTIPLLRFKQLNLIISNFFSNFINIKTKYDQYWIDIFKIFYKVLSNNNQLLNCTNEMDFIWNLFVRKFLISFIDSNKKTNKYEESQYKPELSLIFNFVVSQGNNKFLFLVKLMSEKPTWWEGGKNTVRLYFPEFVKDT